MRKWKILIVEDEILIADTLQRYLEQQGYQVSGIAISYEEAVELFTAEQPDMVLIDIRLSGPKTGIDLALFLQQQTQPVPFIYLTSQTDKKNIDQAKQTFPASFLTKPIQASALYANIEIALHKQETQNLHETKLSIYDGANMYLVPAEDILYLKADHVYVEVYTKHQGILIQRKSLTEMLEDLPLPPFLQVHRSFVINLKAITGWQHHCVFIHDTTIPISRSRRKEILKYLEEMA
ncbi:LytR/AlgR family response regulator transcription factor [Haliscomenobacter sp.]|uniref:LytR/AlgR family response regulator transcription factor n=1 Tax=Haliscomenobacter sp. TaxID=2717303 RepID=UPI003BABB161